MRVCTLASGSSGNAIYIESDNARVLIDAGLSGKAVEERLNLIGRSCADLTGIVVTHEHVDHIKGVGVLSRKYKLPIMATEATWEAMADQLGKLEEKHQVVIQSGCCWECGELKMEVFNTCHDAADPIGLSVFGSKHSLAVLTDTGSVYAGMKKYLTNVDLLICESNYDEDMLIHGSYPWSLKKRIASEQGHLSNRTTAKILAKLIPDGLNNVILAHLSEENNTPRRAMETVEEILREAGIEPGKDVNLQVAPRHNPGQVWDLAALEIS